MAIEQNFSAFIGQDVVLDFTIYDEDATLATIAAATALVQDISGLDIEWSDRIRASDATAQLTKTATITDGPNGRCQVLVAAADTLYWVAEQHDHMLRRIGIGVNVPWVYGRANWQAAAAR